MNEGSELFLQRAENELIAAQLLFVISGDAIMQKEQFKLEREFTFYSSVISHAYYCIFYASKAILLTAGIMTDAPEVHKKTIDAFEMHLVRTGKLDAELLKLYREIVVRADELLGIFQKKKGNEEGSRIRNCHKLIEIL